MTATSDKARMQRLQRLESTLKKRLENPASALEALVSELELGEARKELWEELHAAAMRDGKEQDLGSAYVKLASSRRMQKLELWNQADILMHAADFYQGVLGDAEAAENFLERVQYIAPGHPEAFTRLERRLQALGDPRRLVELYSLVAEAPPPSAGDIGAKVVNLIVPLPASAPISDDACRRLVALTPTDPGLLDTLETHCRKTKRIGLACVVIEMALANPSFPKSIALKQRRHVIDFYMGDANAPGQAIEHVEELLKHYPADEKLHEIAQRLLSVHEVASRAAAALQRARAQARPP